MLALSSGGGVGGRACDVFVTAVAFGSKMKINIFILFIYLFCARRAVAGCMAQTDGVVLRPDTHLHTLS